MSAAAGRVDVTVLGVGAANDLCEPDVVGTLHRYHAAGLANYLTIYIYENYSREFLTSLRSELPEQLKFVWHASDDFELPLDRDAPVRDLNRVQMVQDIFAPAWATEDIVLTSFGGQEKPGFPNYVPMFLTEDCLDVCIRRMRQINSELALLFLPEVPHFYMPVPQTMDLATFFSDLTREADCFLNFDVGHLFSYNLLQGRDLFAGLDDFPLDRIVEINCAGGMVGDPESLTWIDDYAGPLNPLTVEALDQILPSCTNLRAIYSESIGCDDWVLRYNLETLNALFWGRAPLARSAHVPT
jgi:uncharacterized protein (UPF0276 family)